jgi:hypothetical protein
MPDRKRVPTEEEFQETVRENVDKQMTDLREKKLGTKSKGKEKGGSSSDEAR